LVTAHWQDLSGAVRSDCSLSFPVNQLEWTAGVIARMLPNATIS